MKLTNLKIEDLILDELKLTFLVGAGCSIDPPSCIPSARLLMEVIIKYTCAQREINKILKLKELRFEQLIEIIRDSIDPLLEIIEYFEQFDKPNHQHLFLAKMIKKGHFVMTTNFDFLIESALQQLGVPDEDIITIITEEDFKNYPDPNQFFKEGKKVLYKIHGSSKNIITGESTKDSLIATIEALGHGKKGMNIFQIEPFKQPLFKNITNGRSLIVIGYSGSDDFDIGPTLKSLSNLHYFIWIKYNEKLINEEIYEIEGHETNESDKINQLLVDIKKNNNSNRVYRVDVNTSNLIERILDIEIEKSKSITYEEPFNWFEDNIEISSALFYYLIPFKIYLKLQRYEDAIRCAEVISELCPVEDYLDLHLEITNTMGEIYIKLGKYSEAETNFKLTLRTFEELRDSAGKALTLYYLGFLYYEQGRISEALNVLKEGFHIADYDSHIALYLNQFGLIYCKKKNYSKAMKKFTEALEIYEELGDLTGKAKCFNNIALIYKEQKQYDEAIKWCDSAYKINKYLDEPFGKISCLTNKGKIYKRQGKYKNALNLFNEAIKICKNLDLLKEEAVILNNIGILYKDQEDYIDAIDIYAELFEIDYELGDLWGEAFHLNQFSNIYEKMGDIDKAIDLSNEALEIFEDLENLDGKAMIMSNIGRIYEKNGDCEGALKIYKEVLEIYEQLKDNYGKANIICNIGSILNTIRDYSSALEFYKEAIEIFEELKMIQEKGNLLKKIGLIFKSQGNYSEALKSYEEAALIYKKTGDHIGRGLIFLEISNIYGILKDRDEQNKYFKKARPLLREYFKGLI